MTPQKSSTKSPSSSKSSFNLNDLSMREFEAFLIFLKHEGEEFSVLKKFIDLSFKYTSRTKAYDYINSLCKKGLAYKKTTLEKGKKVTRIFITKKIRKEYEKFILPTIVNTKETLKNVFKEYIDDLKDVEKIREKFRAYTENVIVSISNLLVNEPVKTLNSKRFHKKLNDTIWRYFRAEMLKYEMFSK
jgi:predicted transcriptional regulator